MNSLGIKPLHASTSGKSRGVVKRHKRQTPASSRHQLVDWHRRTFAYNAANRDRWVAQCAASVAPGSRVLDVGAGPGRYRPLFAHCEYQTQDFGQEPSTIGQYTPLDYICDITQIPVPDASFDVLLCTEVLEHVPEPIAAVAEMARILKPGGRLFLSAPLGSLLHQEPYHFYGGYTPYWYEKFLTAAGLEVISIEANQGFFSLFAQEAQRFSAYLDPRRTPRRPLVWPAVTLLWAVTLPLFRIVLPVLARPLDRLALERTSTAGYHVTARRTSNLPGHISLWGNSCT